MYYAKFKKLWEWVKDIQKEFFLPTNRDDRSVVLFAIGFVFAILRRVSLGELITHFIFEKRKIPAWAVDFYLIAWVQIWCAVTYIIHLVEVIFLVKKPVVDIFPLNEKMDCILSFLAICLGNFFVVILVFNCLQIVQVNLHRNIWRPIVDPLHRDAAKRRRPRNYGRNLFNAIIGYINLNWIFGIIYWVLGSSMKNAPDNIFHAIYFSFVTGTTLGYGEMSPKESDPWTWLLLLIVVQVLSNILMIAVVFATTTATINQAPQQTVPRAGNRPLSSPRSNRRRNNRRR